jgi:septum formation protein
VSGLVLASSSPRREEILDTLGIRFEVRSPEVDEALRPGETATAAARRLAEEKARAVARAGELVLAADTVVVLGETLLGKPGDTSEAEAMLRRLSGRTHDVCTGLALVRDGRTESGVERTAVVFRPLAASEVREYVATGEPFDKAGAYGIQGRGAALVERIEGDYSNVVGLPVRLLLSLLARFDLRYAFGPLVPAGGGRASRDGAG